MNAILPCVVSAIFVFPAVIWSSPIVVPQVSPYEIDSNTVLLEHFDGTTVGSPNGDVTYTAGVFGQGVHVIDTAWVACILGTIPQGSVDFWANLDNLNNSVTVPNLFSAAYSPFFAGTLFFNVSGNDEANGHLGAPNAGINIAPFNWNLGIAARFAGR